MFKDFSIRGIFQSVVSKVSVSGVMTPLLWTVGLIVPLSILALLWTDKEKVLYFLMVLILSIVAYTFRVYDYYMKKSPHLLQSEGYLIENRKLDLMGDDRLGREMEQALLSQKPEPNSFLSNEADQ